MTRLEALTALKEAVEAGEVWQGLVDFKAACVFGLPRGHTCVEYDALRGAFNGSLDAALALVKETLPGFGYRVMECCVSDDASVFPDYNCPVHGERLKRELGEGDDWFALTDIDMRPPGKPARALLLSVLTALILIEERKT